MPKISDQLERGWRLQQAGDLVAAESVYRDVLAQAPKHADALVYLGIVQFDQRNFEDSVESYRHALSIRDRYPIAWNNLGNSLRMLGRVDEAEACFEKALQLDPRYLSALKNRGTLWVWSGQIQRGLGWYQEGLRIDPENAELHRNLGVIHLLLGDYDVGWSEYRWRWRMPGLVRPSVRAPLWQGEDLSGKTVLLYPEQGRGDAIHFLRSASVIKDRGARVLLQCPPEFAALFSSVSGVDRFLPQATAPPERVDFHASLLDVIDVVYTQSREIPFAEHLFGPGTGYLTVSDPLIEYWKSWLDQRCQKPRLGINWQGNPSHHADVYRSVPLEVLRPLTELTEYELINLQFGYGCEQLENSRFADKIVRLPEHVDTGEGSAFTDTAAILKNLDMVVTTDTAVAHLAGAVGTQVIMLLGKVPDWRWLTEGETTPWYPSIRLVRQRELGQWEDVVEDAIGILKQAT